ncbi:biotin/lipoyl-binding carrier protein [Parapusillimonas granuli]|uniref:Biotin/lipoyl-binding carrier protein n=1 Tax=Parapusillimonas granuli TaxID=380911 RepID=A0A853G051_9BURK|nr:biotin/lipoyl-binding carrier protein [Parapusillimonas granuli]MBB5217003.1 biotin carboxyl carrier protein [Parapusillimonas granuli]MEB2400667.1 biotin/lipoyl-binding carrier protein [Alcaligenaceae bacterium]NYT50233.1 biotin/lipoyl-binding carrier protein [Parapusillimonas granuli]
MTALSITSDITGTVWKVLIKPGDKVEEDDALVILESMKMEIPVLATEAATVLEVRVTEGQAISEGDVVAVLEA